MSLSQNVKIESEIGSPIEYIDWYIKRDGKTECFDI